MPSNTSTAQVVEELAQKKTKYENIFEAQAAELRKDPDRCKESYDGVLKLTGIGSPDQPKVVTAAEKERNMKAMEEICCMYPTSFDDRMKISLAALEVMMYIMTWDIRVQPRDIQLQIMKRSADMAASYQPNASNETPFLPLAQKPMREPLKRPSNMPSEHYVTSAELHSFAQDPFQLLGRQFILHSHGDSTGLFHEVVGLRVSKERTRWYQMQLEGGVDCIEVDSEELTRMIEDSVLLEA